MVCRSRVQPRSLIELKILHSLQVSVVILFTKYNNYGVCVICVFLSVLVPHSLIACFSLIGLTYILIVCKCQYLIELSSYEIIVSLLSSTHRHPYYSHHTQKMRSAQVAVHREYAHDSSHDLLFIVYIHIHSML